MSYGRLDRSSAHAVGYITGTRQLDVRSNIVRDYSNRTDVLAYGRVVPENAPTWAIDANTFWNAVDVHVESIIDKRYKNPETNEYFKKKARTNQRHILSLPIEIGAEEYKDIHKDFVQKLIEKFFTPLGAVVDWAIHNDPGNPHVHVFSSLHMLEDDKLSQTVQRQMYSPAFCKDVRTFMETYYNPILEAMGIEGRVNSKSYQEMGVEVVSQVHEGPYARYLAEKGKGTRVSIANEDIREENSVKILMNTQNMVKLLAANFSTFTRVTAFQFIHKHMNFDAHTTALVFERVMKDVVKVSGVDEDTSLYVTQLYKEQEDKAVDIAESLFSSKTSLAVEKEKIEAYFALKDEEAMKNGGFSLSDEQKNAVRLFCGSKQLSLVVGRAGTGKTTAMAAVVELLKAEKIEVFGASMAAEAAHNLEKEAHVSSSTIDSFLFSEKMVAKIQDELKREKLTSKERLSLEKKLLTHKSKCLKKDCALIVDEAGMVGVEMYSKLFELAKERNVKLMLVGDDRQLKSISAGDMFRYLVQKSQTLDTHASITRIFRQKEEWMREASIEFSELNVKSALKSYEASGYLHKFEDEEALLDKMADQYLDLPSHASSCVLAYANDTVTRLNQKIRSKLQLQGRLPTQEVNLFGQSFAVGDRFVFLKNTSQSTPYAQEVLAQYFKISGPHSQKMKVRNGMHGTILSIEALDRENQERIGTNETHYKVEVLVKEKGEDHVVSFWTNTISEFTHGYAMTLSKSQGQTVDFTLLYLNKMLDSFATYVGFTRHKEEVHAYYLESEFQTFETLCDSLSRINNKDIIADFDHKTHDHEILDTVNGYKEIGYQISVSISSGAYEDVHYLKQEQKYRALEILDDFEKYAPTLLAKGVTKFHLEKAAGLQERVLSEAETALSPTVEAYIHVHQKYMEVRGEIEKTHSSIHSQHHEDYVYLQQLQERRGDLAQALKAKSNLTKAFARDIFEGCGYGLSVIDVQAERYEKELLKKETLAKLTYEDKSLLALYEDGVLHLKESVKLYKQQKAYDEKHLKLKEGETFKNVIFKTMNTKESIERKTHYENVGSGVMYYFENNPSLLKRVYEIIDTYDPLPQEVKARRTDAAMRFSDKLLIAKAAGEDQLSDIKDAETFLHTHPITDHVQFYNKAVETERVKLEAAAHLVERLKLEKQKNDSVENEQDKRSPLKAKIMRQVGFEGLIQIYNHARDAERLKVTSLFGRESIDGDLIALIEYGQAKQEAYHWWKLVKEEAQENNIAYEATQHYEMHQKASAQKDIAAYYAVERYGIEALKRANALLKEKNLGLRIDNLEREAERGRIHHACQTIHNPLALEHMKEDARDTLLIANLLETEAYFKAGEDKPSRYVFGIMASYGISSHELAQGLSAFTGKTKHVFNLDDFNEEKPLIEAYKESIIGFSKAYIALVKDNPEGSKALRAETLSPEAIAVHEAIQARNAAAFALYQTNFLTTFEEKNIQGLYKFLKVSQTQFIKHVDEYESKHLVSLFKAQTDEAQQKEIALKLVEKMNLQFACKEFSTVRAAILEAGLEMKTFYEMSRELTKYPLLPKNKQDLIKAYEVDVEESRRTHEIARKQLIELQAKIAMEQKKDPFYKERATISKVAIYDTYWQANMDASEKAYALLQDKEVRDALSTYDALTMGRYAHQYETILMLMAFKKADAYRNPIACLIAREMNHMLAFEALPENGEGENKLMKGTYGLVFSQQLRWGLMDKLSAHVIDGPAIRYRDVEYLNTMIGSYLPPHAMELLRQTSFVPEYEGVIQSHGYEEILKNPSKPYVAISQTQVPEMMASPLDNNTQTHQERDMRALNESNQDPIMAVQAEGKSVEQEKEELKAVGQSVVEPFTSSLTATLDQSFDQEVTSPITEKNNHLSVIKIDTNKLAEKKTNKGKTYPQKQNSRYIELTQFEKDAIYREYKNEFTARISKPSSYQDRAVYHALGSHGEPQRDGSYHFKTGSGKIVFYPYGVGGSKRSVFKMWDMGTENFGLYDVAKRSGYCYSYKEFVEKIGDAIGFRQQDFFNQKLEEIRKQRGLGEGNTQSKVKNAGAVTVSTADYTPHLSSVQITEGKVSEHFVQDAPMETKNGLYIPLSVVPKNRENIYPKAIDFAANLHGTPTMRFAYRHLDGSLMGYVVRFEKEGQKALIPFAFCSQIDKKAQHVWRSQRFNGGIEGSSPLYGLEKLKKNPNAIVLLVEGEKSADAAQKQFPDFVVMSWIGGVGSVGKINLEPLLRRNVVMWPDNDEAGLKAADKLKAQLKKIDVKLEIVDIPQAKLPLKWDLADVLPNEVTHDEIRSLVMKAAQQVREHSIVHTPILPVPYDAHESMPFEIEQHLQDNTHTIVRNEQGKLLYYKLNQKTDEKEKGQGSSYVMYCRQGQSEVGWKVVDGSVWKTIAKEKNTSAVVPLHGLEKLKDKAADQPIIVVEGHAAANRLQAYVEGKAIVLGTETGFLAKQLDLSPLKGKVATLILTDQTRSFEENKEFQTEMTYYQRNLKVLSFKTPKTIEEEKRMMETSLAHLNAAGVQQELVKENDIFKQSKGLFAHEVTFNDVKDVCEQYKLADLLERNDAKQLALLTYQSMVNLQSLTSWSTILERETDMTTLKDQAVLSSLLCAYAKKKLELGNSIEDTLKAKGIGFEMAREALQNKEVFKNVMDTALEQAHVRENTFEKEMENVVQKRTLARKDGMNILDPNITQNVSYQSQYCKSSFGENLPAFVMNHLCEVLYAHHILAQRDHFEVSPVVGNLLINHTLYKNSSYYSSQEIKTTDDLQKFMHENGEFVKQHADRQSASIEAYLKRLAVEITTDEKEKSSIYIPQALEVEKVKASVRYSDTYLMTNGLYEKLVSFHDVKDVCERYDVSELISHKNSDELICLVSQSLLDLKNISSWSSLLSLGKDDAALKDQAILSTVMTAYAKEELNLKDTFENIMYAKGIGFHMARQYMTNKSAFLHLGLALKNAEKEEKAFFAQQNEKIKQQQIKQISPAAFTDHFAQNALDQYNHFSKSAFDSTLPNHINEHLKKQVVKSVQMMPIDSSKQLHEVYTQILMSHESYKFTNPHVQREIKTHEDLTNLFHEQAHFQKAYQSLQKFQTIGHVQENMKSRDNAMSL